MKRILIIEDDKRMNEIVCDYFEIEGYKVFQAYDGVQGLELFQANDIDLVIVDIMMPKLDGWSVCRRIRQKSSVLIVIISARSEDDDKLMGFEFGADEYVAKPFSPKVLVAQVKALMKRVEVKEASKENVMIKGLLTIDEASHVVLVMDKEVFLTGKEFEILTTLASNEGKVMSRDILIEKIWGYDYFGDGRVVDTNIKTLRRKISVCSSYITTVIGIGYKFEVNL